MVKDNGDGTITIPAGVEDFTITFPGLEDDIQEEDERPSIVDGTNCKQQTITMMI
jgi:hypothetical protein